MSTSGDVSGIEILTWLALFLVSLAGAVAFCIGLLSAATDKDDTRRAREKREMEEWRRRHD